MPKLRADIMKKEVKADRVFYIEIVETLSQIVEIVAKDEQTTLLKAQELYRNEEIVLYADNFIDTEFNILNGNRSS